MSTIRKIEADANMEEQRAIFSTFDNHGNADTVYITYQEGSFQVVHDPGAGGDKEPIEGATFSRWNDAAAYWNRWVAGEMRQLDPGVIITGRDAMKITGLSAPGLSLAAGKLGVEGKIYGRAKVYTPEDVARILERPLPGRDAWNTETPAVTEMIRERLKNDDTLNAHEYDMLMARYGLDGNPPQSLQDLADDAGITRQGVKRRIDRLVERLTIAKQ